MFGGFLGVDVPLSTWNGGLEFMEGSEREKKVGGNQNLKVVISRESSLQRK